MATVTGIGSLWDHSAWLSVGNSGMGMLSIENGGVVDTTGGFIGRYSGSVGNVTVSGIGSLWDSEIFMSVGFEGDGTLIIEAGGVVSNDYSNIGENTGSLGVVTVDGTGSMWTTGVNLNIGGDGAAAGGTGSLSINDGGSVTVGGDLKIWESDDTLGIGIGSLADPFLDVSGDAYLTGILDVSLVGGFTPTAGDSFEIITAASILGTFATETLPTLAGGLEWFVNYSSTSVELVSTFAGDFNFDGDVDGGDFLKWQRDYTGSAQDDIDLADWEANFGAVVSLAAASAAVPEPSSFALIAVGLLGMSCRRRKQA